MKALLFAGTASAAFLMAGGGTALTSQVPPEASRCAALAGRLQGHWPEAGTRIASAEFRAAGPAPNAPASPGMQSPPVQLPAHCELISVMHERQGVDGQHYAIRFHLRLPAQWNGRLFFQGGGGTNGELGDAIGRLSGSAAPALVQGYAVLSQDSGHDNAVNSDPARGGASAFGFDPQARADYGGASLRPVALAAQAAIRQFYGRAPRYSYFVGCSKGGQEGMALAQRYPELFDGIIAGSPGFSLPRAAVAEAWDTQSFAEIPRASGQPVTLQTIAAAFSDADLALVRQAVLDACDALDGAKDHIVGAVGHCTSERVLPNLAKVTCQSAKTDACLSRAQVGALRRIHDGARNSKGEALYASFPWDAGWADMGWRIWKTGSPDGRIPSINIAMGAPSLATVFTTPPTNPGAGPQALLAYQLGFDFDRDAPRIYTTAPQFARSAWQDIGARSPDLSGFRSRGGKMIVPQGVSDPVFSITDTFAWWDEVDRRSGGQAAKFVQVFAVPGMGHCQGGPATDQFDAFADLVRWVEQGKAPDRIDARAGPMTPWPNRSRPLCRYPLVARLEGAGHTDSERADAFACTAD